MTVASPTPEFVRWSIAQPCPLREFDAWQDPEQVERRLRPLRAYCEAVAEGRLFEGICVAADATASAVPKGFRAAEVLDAFGGASFLSIACGLCPANARLGAEPEPLAGCFGHFEFSGLESFHDDLEWVAADFGLATKFLTTSPWWYGLWIESPPSVTQLELLAKLCEGLAARNEAYRARLGVFPAAMRLCLQHSLPMHLTLVPRGEYTATRWTIVSHCGRCKAPWPKGSRRCSVCGLEGHPRPSRRRHVRGERPYWRLAGFLGAGKVEPFLNRYLTEKLMTEK